MGAAGLSHGEIEQDMSEDEKIAEQRKRMGLPPGIDPRNFDLRKALDPVALERVIRAQEMARAQAQATTQVLIGTIVTLVTSAFGFVAALAWNSAITEILNDNIQSNQWKNLPKWAPLTIYAVIVTLIAVVVVVLLNRIAGRAAKKSVIQAGG